MLPKSLPQFLKVHDVILGEGTVIERIKRESNQKLDPFVVNADNFNFRITFYEHGANLRKAMQWMSLQFVIQRKY